MTSFQSTTTQHEEEAPLLFFFFAALTREKKRPAEHRSSMMHKFCSNALEKLSNMESEQASNLLQEIVSLLGATYGSVKGRKEAGADAASLADKLIGHRSSDHREGDSLSCTFPCLSLDKDQSIPSSYKGHRPREEVKSQAADLLSRTIAFDALAEDPSLLRHVPQLLVENLYSALDVLVDARIGVYSKVLQSHALVMAKNHADDTCQQQRQAIDFKLQTLLEIGTNLAANGISTSFTVPEGAVPKFEGDSISLPFILEAQVHHLAIPSPHLGKDTILSLTFSSSGVVSGKLCHLNNFLLGSYHLQYQCCSLFIEGTILSHLHTTTSELPFARQALGHHQKKKPMTKEISIL
jgi:hypothetical protein